MLLSPVAAVVVDLFTAAEAAQAVIVLRWLVSHPAVAHQPNQN